MNKFGICCALLLFGVLHEANAQGWRGIVPLHSSCEDAKRVLNLSNCAPSTVELEDAKVFINFSEGACTSDWNVPSGTVLTLDVWPRQELTPADLSIDLTRFSKTINRDRNTVRLNNLEIGMSIDLSNEGRIWHMFYGPSSKDQHLHCGRALSSGSETGSVLFDEYGFIPFEKERPRLDAFATMLSGWSGTRGYIIVYPGSETEVKEAKTRASRAESYLVEKKGFRDKIVTVIGGSREEPSVELFITVQNGSPPLPTPPRDSRP